jgi:hypothetical protein
MQASKRAARSGVGEGMGELTSGKIVLSSASVYVLLRKRSEEGSINCCVRGLINWVEPNLRSLHPPAFFSISRLREGAPIS